MMSSSSGRVSSKSGVQEGALALGLPVGMLLGCSHLHPPPLPRRCWLRAKGGGPAEDKLGHN